MLTSSSVIIAAITTTTIVGSAGQDADDAQESEDVAGLERPGKPAGTGQLVALPWAGGRYRVADYDVHRHSGVSFHIPLHRLLTRLLVAASLVWRAPLHSFFPDAYAPGSTTTRLYG